MGTVQRVASIQNRRAAEGFDHGLRQEPIEADEQGIKGELPLFSNFA